MVEKYEPAVVREGNTLNAELSSKYFVAYFVVVWNENRLKRKEMGTESLRTNTVM